MKIWHEATAAPRAIIDGIIEPRIANAQKNAMENSRRKSGHVAETTRAAHAL